jgi:hypothetical protein
LQANNDFVHKTSSCHPIECKFSHAYLHNVQKPSCVSQYQALFAAFTVQTYALRGLPGKSRCARCQFRQVIAPSHGLGRLAKLLPEVPAGILVGELMSIAVEYMVQSRKTFLY